MGYDDGKLPQNFEPTARTAELYANSIYELVTSLSKEGWASKLVFLCYFTGHTIHIHGDVVAGGKALEAWIQEQEEPALTGPFAHKVMEGLLYQIARYAGEIVTTEPFLRSMAEKITHPKFQGLRDSLLSMSTAQLSPVTNVQFKDWALNAAKKQAEGNIKLQVQVLLEIKSIVQFLIDEEVLARFHLGPES